MEAGVRGWEGGGMDLRDFILRAKVLRVYRDALRAARKAPIGTRGKCEGGCHVARGVSLQVLRARCSSVHPSVRPFVRP